MSSVDYDLIVVGGGLGGACFAKAMVETGARVLVLERTTRFKDQVRGEVLWPWGVLELKKLGCYDLLRDAVGRDVLWFDVHMGPTRVDHQDLVSMTQQCALNFSHPEMQETVLRAAAEAGAEVLRGVVVSAVAAGERPSASFARNGTREERSARMVVCANGKQSGDESWAGLPVRRDTIGLRVAGTLLGGVAVPDTEANYWVVNPELGQAALLAPQRDGLVRSYFLSSKQSECRFRGMSDVSPFVSELIQSGVPADWFSDIQGHGPLATFDGTGTCVPHPYRDGVALIGDAAATTDPSYGQGMSLTCRDARVLRDELLARDDWERAGHLYAEEHDRYYTVLNTVIHWFWDLFYDHGPEAEAKRAKAFPLLAQDVSRVPDTLVCGPESSSDEHARQRFFGEV